MSPYDGIKGASSEFPQSTGHFERYDSCGDTKSAFAPDYEFREQLKKGELAEQIFMLFMEQRKQLKKICNWKDVRKNPSYQDIDVDFIYIDKRGKEIRCEVKNDSYSSGNLFAEQLVTHYTEDREGNILQASTALGWAHKSKADKIFYFFEKSSVAYFIDRKQFNAWVDWVLSNRNLKSENRTFHVTPFQSRSALNYPSRHENPSCEVKSYYYGVGYLVPTKDIVSAPRLKNHLWVLKVEDYNLNTGEIKTRLK